MPEGPEIHRAADKLAKALVDRPLEHVAFGLTRLEDFGAGLVGATPTAVEAWGKALLVRFDTGRVLYSHNQLYGRWYVVRPEAWPKTNRSLRVDLRNGHRWSLLYSASEIELLEADEVGLHPYLAKLGPDLLHDTTTPERIEEQLDDKRFRGRALGGLLLDQGFLAGVGNYLRSEILFFAGLPPETRPKDLSEGQRGALAKVAKQITVRSYRTGGTTEENSLAKDAKARGEPRRLWRHAVFARAGEACRRCGGTIERHEVAGRRLYRCLGCT